MSRFTRHPRISFSLPMYDTLLHRLPAPVASAVMVALLLALPLLPGRLDAQARSLDHAGARRRYIVYAPDAYAADTTRRFPVVLNFHGGGMTMAEQMMYTGMNRVADSAQFIAVYPQGIGQDWNVGFGTSYREGTDDVGFVEALLAQLARDYRIDGARIYATGLSRGGFFCHRLAVELSHRIAAIVTVGAPVPVPVIREGKPRGAPHAVGVLMLHGGADRIVAFSGKADGYLSADSSYGFWTARNRLVAAPDRRRTLDRDPGDGTSVQWRERTDGTTTVALAAIDGGGHTWAGADAFNVGLPIGPTSREVDATRAAWEFLRRHRR